MLAPAEAAAHPGKRVRRPLWTSAWVLVLVLVVLGFGFVASRSAAPPEQGTPHGGVADAQRAVQALLAPGDTADAIARLPPDFTEVTDATAGTVPARDGRMRAVHVGGGCSTPWGADSTRWDYGVPCQAHDLGYDLLRYAEEKGQPLDPAMRKALDDRLTADMHAMCRINPEGSAETCDMVASAYSAALVLNSWHQRWGPPVGEPIGPMLAGVTAIGALLTFRLRGWLRVRKAAPRPAPEPEAPVPPTPPARAAQASSVPVTGGGRWAVLGVSSIVLLVLGEAAVMLARWVGVDDSLLWPITWLAQLACVFFFAGGHANAAGWRAVVESGGGYRQYLAHRAGWLLRPALVFAVVAFAVPMALELLAVPQRTTANVVRMALHPLWLLGVYLLTVALTPAMLALHRRVRWLAPLGLLGLVALAELSAGWFASPLPRYLAVFGLALLAQQLAFAHESTRAPRWVLAAAAGLATAGLVLLTTLGDLAPGMLAMSGHPPVLAGPTLPVLLLGVVQLGVLGLLAGPLGRIAGARALTRAAGFALRAPMTLYLGFLTAMLLVIAAVYLPERIGDGLSWLTQPRSLLALALPAVPGVLLFWWFERHLGSAAVHLPRPDPALGRLDTLLGRAAAAFGVAFAAIGLFGLALAGFGGVVGEAHVLGVSLDPIQSLVQLLLGVCMLHTVRTGASGATSTWVLVAVACVPPALAATAGETVDLLGLAVHGVTMAFALAATVATVVVARRPVAMRP